MPSFMFFVRETKDTEIVVALKGVFMTGGNLALDESDSGIDKTLNAVDWKIIEANPIADHFKGAEINV